MKSTDVNKSLYVFIFIYIKSHISSTLLFPTGCMQLACCKRGSKRKRKTRKTQQPDGGRQALRLR